MFDPKCFRNAGLELLVPSLVSPILTMVPGNFFHLTTMPHYFLPNKPVIMSRREPAALCNLDDTSPMNGVDEMIQDTIIIATCACAFYCLDCCGHSHMYSEGMGGNGRENSGLRLRIKTLNCIP